MKIVLVGPVAPYRGGIAYFTATLARQLEASGHQVQLISFRKQYPRLLYPGKSDKDNSLGKPIIGVIYPFSPFNPLDWHRTLTEIKRFSPDLVIYQWWVTFWAPATAWLLGRLNRLNIPIKILIHNTFPHEARWFDRAATSWALRNANSFVTMAEVEAIRLKTVIPENAEVQIATHPVFQQFPASGLSKAAVRAQLGLPADAPLALFFGFVRPYKGLEVLLDAMHLLKQNDSPIHLVIAGEFWQSQATYESLIRKLGLEEKVSIHAYYIPDNKAGLYFEAADMFVAPYLDGTQSGSIKQAMSYNLPLVISDVIADPMIRAYNCGLEITPAGDAVVLAKAMQNALSIQKGVKKCGDYAQESWNNLISALTTSHNRNTAGS
jgi:glycosyltransferase involved in cell wall biosynthesis